MSKTTHIVIITCLALTAFALAAAVLTDMFRPGATTAPPPSAQQDASSSPANAKTVTSTDTEKQQQYEEFMEWIETEAENADQIAESQSAPPDAAPVPNQPSPIDPLPTPDAPAAGVSQTMPTWQTIWADLNLTEEEQTRIRQGFGLAIQRYMQMSPEQQAAERQRMQSMRLRWEAMNDDQKAQTSQRIRDRFEDWRQSGAVELPELSLD